MQHIWRFLLKPKPFPIKLLTRNLTDDITSPPPVKTDNLPSTNNRIVRQEPGKVMLGFIPVEWAELFYSRTGVTGFGTFCFTFGIYLMSKEKLVMEHEYYGGLSTALLWYFVTTQLGPDFGKSVDKEIDAYEAGWNAGRVAEQEMLEDAIQMELKLQDSSRGQLILVQAKRDNVGLQLEANFRERQMMVYREVKKRLDYYVRREEIERRIAQKNMAAWVMQKVLDSITPEQENKNIDKCIEDLAVIANR